MQIEFGATSCLAAVVFRLGFFTVIKPANCQKIRSPGDPCEQPVIVITPDPRENTLALGVENEIITASEKFKDRGFRHYPVVQVYIRQKYDVTSAWLNAGERNVTAVVSQGATPFTSCSVVEHLVHGTVNGCQPVAGNAKFGSKSVAKCQTYLEMIKDGPLDVITVGLECTTPQAGITPTQVTDFKKYAMKRVAVCYGTCEKKENAVVISGQKLQLRRIVRYPESSIVRHNCAHSNEPQCLAQDTPSFSNCVDGRWIPATSPVCNRAIVILTSKPPSSSHGATLEFLSKRWQNGKSIKFLQIYFSSDKNHAPGPYIFAGEKLRSGGIAHMNSSPGILTNTCTAVTDILRGFYDGCSKISHATRHQAQMDLPGFRQKCEEYVRLMLPKPLDIATYGAAGCGQRQLGIVPRRVSNLEDYLEERDAFCDSGCDVQSGMSILEGSVKQFGIYEKLAEGGTVSYKCSSSIAGNTEDGCEFPDRSILKCENGAWKDSGTLHTNTLGPIKAIGTQRALISVIAAGFGSAFIVITGCLAVAWFMKRRSGSQSTTTTATSRMRDVSRELREEDTAYGITSLPTSASRDALVSHTAHKNISGKERALRERIWCEKLKTNNEFTARSEDETAAYSPL